MEYNTLYQAIEAKLSEKTTVTVAIDGGAASGKTTLSRALSAHFGAPIIHMDDFFLRPEQRTKERYETVGGNIDYERFLAEVAPHLQGGYGFTYRRFDCKQMCLCDTVEIPPHSLLIVEGSYSLRPEFQPYYDLTVLLRIDPKEQLSRIEKRNGKEKLITFREKWIPLEERYLSALDLEHTVDFIFNG